MTNEHVLVANTSSVYHMNHNSMFSCELLVRMSDDQSNMRTLFTSNTSSTASSVKSSSFYFYSQPYTNSFCYFPLNI